MAQLSHLISDYSVIISWGLGYKILCEKVLGEGLSSKIKCIQV